MNPRRTLATSARVLKQLHHDKRTLGLLFVVPLVLLGLLAWIYSDTPRVFDQKRFSKRIAAARQQRVRDLFHARIQRPHDRDVTHDGVPPGHELLTDEVLREQTDDEDERQRQQRADARQMEAEELFGLPRSRQQEQRLVHRTDDEPEHP